MTEEEKVLWEKIRNFALNEPDSNFDFTDRLCRENGWDIDFSIRAIHEYKKFIFLIISSKQALTPSDQVDVVWHLHLLYTRSYWTDFCQNTLGREIHHGPTKGGGDEQSKFSDWYAKTKEFYRKKFGATPPPDIWPSSEIRFKEINFRRVNLDRYWLIPKPFKK